MLYSSFTDIFTPLIIYGIAKRTYTMWFISLYRSVFFFTEANLLSSSVSLSFFWVTWFHLHRIQPVHCRILEALGIFHSRSITLFLPSELCTCILLLVGRRVFVTCNVNWIVQKNVLAKMGQKSLRPKNNCIEKTLRIKSSRISIRTAHIIHKKMLTKTPKSTFISYYLMERHQIRHGRRHEMCIMRCNEPHSGLFFSRWLYILLTNFNSVNMCKQKQNT